MSRISKIVGVVVVLLVALIVAGVAILKNKDFNEYRGLIAEQVKAATGRTLTIAGDLKLELSMQPSIAVEGVSLANAAWGSRPKMASVKRLEVKIKLLPLFMGDIEVVRVVMSGVDAIIEISKDGVSNLNFSNPSETPKASSSGPSSGFQAASLPVVHSVEFRNIRLTYYDARNGKKLSLTLDRLKAASDSLDSPIKIDIAGAVNGQPLTARAVLGSYKTLFEGGKPWPVSLSAGGPGLSLRVDGTIGRPLQAAGLDLRIAFKADNAATAAALAGLKITDLPPFKLSALLRNTKSGYSLTGLKIVAGNSDLSGRLGLALNGPRPALKAALRSNLIDLDQWLPAGSGGTSGGSTGSGTGGDKRIFPATPLPLAALKAADADISLRADRLTGKGLTMNGVVLKLALSNGLLKISPISAGLAGGRLKAALTLNSRSAPPRFKLNVKSKGLDIGALFKDAGVIDIFRGAVTIKSNVSGRGNSVRALMAGLNGRFSIVGRGGRIDSAAIEGVSKGLLDVLPWIGTKDIGKINCIIGRFDIVAGQARSRALVVDTGGITVTGRGTLDLARERINIAIDSRAKNASLAKLALPIDIGGTFAAPTFTPDMARTVAGLASGTAGVAGDIVKAPLSVIGSLLQADGKTTKTANPCRPALAGQSGKKSAAARPAPPPPAPKPVRKNNETGVINGIDKLGKGLTKSLGGLFGN